MQDSTAQQILSALIEQAQEGKSLEFRFIRSWNEFQYSWRLHKTTKLIIKALKDSNNKLLKEYCKDVIAGVSDVNKLLAFKQLQAITAFYEKDLETLKRMIDDYDEYLGNGNFWYSLLGGERDIWNIQ